MSRTEFAAAYRVSIANLHGQEIGHHKLLPAVHAILKVIAKMPEVIARALEKAA